VLSKAKHLPRFEQLALVIASAVQLFHFKKRLLIWLLVAQLIYQRFGSAIFELFGQAR
jgi:hypothetical protein